MGTFDFVERTAGGISIAGFHGIASQAGKCSNSVV